MFGLRIFFFVAAAWCSGVAVAHYDALPLHAYYLLGVLGALCGAALVRIGGSGDE